MKILVVALDNIGDVVMATSVIKPLRAAYPGCRIDFWIKDYARGALMNDGAISRVHACDPFWDKSPGRTSGSIQEFIAVWKDIRGERYDAALILNAEWRRALAALMARIPQRVGYRKRRSRLFLTRSFPFQTKDHVTLGHARLVDCWVGRDVSGSNAHPHLISSEANRRAAEEWLEGKKWSAAPLALVHPFSGDKIKTWPLERWEKLLAQLTVNTPGWRYGIIAGEFEKNKLASLAALNPAAIAFVPADLFLLKGLAEKAKIFIGGDSGPGHIAAAMGCDVISLFGPTDPSRYGPSGSGTIRIIHKNPIDQINVEDVLEKWKELT